MLQWSPVVVIRGRCGCVALLAAGRAVIYKQRNNHHQRIYVVRCLSIVGDQFFQLQCIVRLHHRIRVKRVEREREGVICWGGRTAAKHVPRTLTFDGDCDLLSSEYLGKTLATVKQTIEHLDGDGGSSRHW